MALFGKKKLSLDEILKGINDLSEEDKAKLGDHMKDLYKAEDEREIDKIESEKADNAEKADEKENEVKEESEEIGKDVDEIETEVAEDKSEDEGSFNDNSDPALENPNNVEKVESEEEVEEVPMTEAPIETPNTQVEGTQGASNYEELIAAQSARIDSLEGVVSALRETVEKIVENHDNKNFGYSPKANFEDDVPMSRRDAILNSYAPRRADQYK